MLTRLPIPETNTNDGISLLGNLFLQASTSSLNFQAIYQHRRESTPFGISFKINHKSEHVSVMFQIFVSSLVKLILLLPLILQTLFFFFFWFLFYGTNRNGDEDPCVPKAFVWSGFNCSNINYIRHLELYPGKFIHAFINC